MIRPSGGSFNAPVRSSSPLPVFASPALLPATTLPVVHAVPSIKPVGSLVGHTNQIVPQKLTDGMPDVHAIEKQKAAYALSLEQQLAEGIRVLNEQNKQRKDYLKQVAEQQKAQFNLQVDQQLKAQEMALDQQYNHQLMTLQQAAHEQKSALEAQANSLALDYQQKKATEDFQFQQYDIQKQHYEAQAKLHDELAQLHQQERETHVPQVSIKNPLVGKVTGSYVPPIAGGPLASYSPPPVVFSSRPAISHTPASAIVAPGARILEATRSALPTATLVAHPSTPVTAVYTHATHVQ